MDEVRLVRISRSLSKYLRHDPAGLGLTLAPGGWVRVDDLLTALSQRGLALSRAELQEVVANNNKQRFSFDETGMRIRANQGHSVDIDLQLNPTAPPNTLYHGTGHQTAPIIAREGLRKMRRHHVHLSGDPETARAVGARHGRPVIFTVHAAAMAQAGYVFFRSENGVWLTDAVPPEFLKTPNPQ